MSFHRQVSKTEPFLKRLYEAVNTHFEWEAPLTYSMTQLSLWAGEAGLGLEEVMPVIQALEGAGFVKPIVAAEGIIPSAVCFFNPIPPESLSPAKAPQAPYLARNLHDQHHFLYLYGDSERKLHFVGYPNMTLKEGLAQMHILPEDMAASARLTSERFATPEEAAQGLQVRTQGETFGPLEERRWSNCRVRVTLSTYLNRYGIFIPYSRRWEYSDFLEHRACSFPEYGKGGAPLFLVPRPTRPLVLEEWDGQQWVEIFNHLHEWNEPWVFSLRGKIRGEVLNILQWRYSGYTLDMGRCRELLAESWETYLPLQMFLQELARAEIIELHQEPGPHLTDDEPVATFNKEIPRAFDEITGRKRIGEWIKDGYWRFRLKD